MKLTIKILVLMFLSAVCYAGSSDAVNGFYPFTYKAADNSTMPYRLFAPANVKKGEKYPLLIHFHGAGSRGNDNYAQMLFAKPFAEKQIQEKNPCFILAPQCPANKKWVDTDWKLLNHKMLPVTQEMQLAMDIISKVISENPVDTNRIYLTGQSMGAFAVWDIICRKPDMFAAAVPVCGGADETKADLVKNVPIWAFHGAKDKTVNVVRTRNMIEALKKAGGNPRYTEYENVEHNAWEFAYKEKDLPEWLFQQKKNNKE